MKRGIAWQAWLIAASLAAGCAAQGEKQQPAHPVDGVRKVIDSLAAEAAQRVRTDPFRSLPIVVKTTVTSSGGLETIIAEFLRTRLVERGVTVNATCGTRCMEMTLQEFSIDAPRSSGFTPGQIITAGGGYIPVVGGLIRSLGEKEQEKQRVAARATGVIVTFAAREGDRYTARVNVVAFVSSGSGDVALEEK
jgi:hypothetical protein